MNDNYVNEILQSIPEYINIEIFDSKRDMLRITNLMLDGLNNRKCLFYEMFISDVAQVLPYMPDFGAYLLVVQGSDYGMPAGTYGVADNGTAASVSSIVAINGVGDWNVALTVTDSSGDVTIKHGRAGVSARFYITTLGYF